MPRRPRPSRPVTESHTNGGSLTFNVMDYLAQMEARLSARIDEVKIYCPNTARMAKTESLVKWWGSVIIASFAAIAGVIAKHILSGK